MFNSLKLIESVCTSDLDGLSLEEVVFKFQNTDDKKLQNRCFAKVFCELFPMILKIHHKFKTLTFSERTEECIYCTYHAMKRYKFNGAKNKMKFSSFLYLVVQNSLKGLVLRLNNNSNRKVWSNMVECDSKLLNHIYNSIKANNTTNAREFILDLENSNILNKQEVDYCKGILLGYKSNKDMTDLVELVPKRKYDRKTKQFITTPLSDTNKLVQVSKIKKNLKEKVKNNNYSFI